MNGGGEVLDGRARQSGFFIEKVQESHSFLLEQVDAVTVVIVLNVRNVEALVLVQVLFLFENAVVEELLQLLVTVVDAELFKGVVLEELEPSNVQNADEVFGVFDLEAVVNVENNIVKELAIDGLG